MSDGSDVIATTGAKPKGRAQTPAQRQRQRERHRAWVARNRDEVNEKARRHRARAYLRDGVWPIGGEAKRVVGMVTAIKSGPCHDCGQTFPTCCMDFDHRPGTTKCNNVGSMVARHYSWEKIEAEIAKCDLVCSNCHRVRTQGRRRGTGKTRHEKVLSDFAEQGAT